MTPCGQCGVSGEIDMEHLQGSPKQIEWAERILAAAVPLILAAAADDAEREYAAALVAKATRADWWIDRRGLGGDGLAKELASSFGKDVPPPVTVEPPKPDMSAPTWFPADPAAFAAKVKTRFRMFPLCEYKLDERLTDGLKPGDAFTDRRSTITYLGNGKFHRATAGKFGYVQEAIEIDGTDDHCGELLLRLAGKAAG